MASSFNPHEADTSQMESKDTKKRGVNDAQPSAGTGRKSKRLRGGDLAFDNPEEKTAAQESAARIEGFHLKEDFNLPHVVQRLLGNPTMVLSDDRRETYASFDVHGLVAFLRDAFAARGNVIIDSKKTGTGPLSEIDPRLYEAVYEALTLDGFIDRDGKILKEDYRSLEVISKDEIEVLMKAYGTARVEYRDDNRDDPTPIRWKAARLYEIVDKFLIISNQMYSDPHGGIPGLFVSPRSSDVAQSGVEAPAAEDEAQDFDENTISNNNGGEGADAGRDMDADEEEGNGDNSSPLSSPPPSVQGPGDSSSPAALASNSQAHGQLTSLRQKMASARHKKIRLNVEIAASSTAMDELMQDHAEDCRKLVEQGLLMNEQMAKVVAQSATLQTDWASIKAKRDERDSVVAFMAGHSTVIDGSGLTNSD
ncbi:hypothetical protein ACHAQA_006262 [Verticillium albo-atrum]